jgi:hypothetical protein
MRPDGVLTELPTSAWATAAREDAHANAVVRCANPSQIARDGRTPWQSTEATLYRRKTTVK